MTKMYVLRAPVVGLLVYYITRAGRWGSWRYLVLDIGAGAIVSFLAPKASMRL